MLRIQIKLSLICAATVAAMVGLCECERTELTRNASVILGSGSEVSMIEVEDGKGREVHVTTVSEDRSRMAILRFSVDDDSNLSEVLISKDEIIFTLNEVHRYRVHVADTLKRFENLKEGVQIDLKEYEIDPPEEGKSPKSDLSRCDIQELAKKRLDELRIDYSDRECEVSYDPEVATCVFPPPANVRGGDFVVVIDLKSGDVVDVKI